MGLWIKRVALASLAACLATGALAVRTAADQAAPPVTLIALAAANTTDPFNDVIGAFESRHPGVLVVPEYAGTQVLQTQAEQGAPFDVFVSADEQHVAALAREGLVQGVELLSEGHEVIVVPKDDPAGIRSLRDLADKPAKLVLGTDAVPIGAYTRRILAKASNDYGPDFPARVLAHAVSLETNVKQVLEKVALGEADAGVVYFTDVTPRYRDKVQIVPIPRRYEVEAANYIAVASGSKHADLARDLVATAVGSDGRLIFRRHGYDPLP